MLTVTILLDSVEKVQRFVSTISKYSCGFDVESGYSCVDGKSLVGLFSLDISKPLQLTINDGEGEIEDVLVEEITSSYAFGFYGIFICGMCRKDC